MTRLEATDDLDQLRPELGWLARATYPCGRIGLLVMLDAFMDESHDEKAERIFCISGFVAQPGAWNRLWARWSAMLEQAGIPVFHMADCEGGHGDFEGMSPKDREDLQRKAIGIILSSDIVIAGAASAIELEAYARLRPEIEKYRFFLPGSPVSGSMGDPYFLAFQQTLDSVCNTIRVVGLPSSEKIGFTFDRHHLGGRASHLYDMLLKSPTISYAKRLGPLAFADKREMVPLQAADLLAYESYRFLRDTYFGKQPERWQWQKLNPVVTKIRGFGEAELLKLIARMERQATKRAKRAIAAPGRP